LELSRTLTSGTTIQREVTEEIVRLTSRVSINHEKDSLLFFSTGLYIIFSTFKIKQPYSILSQREEEKEYYNEIKYS